VQVLELRAHISGQNRQHQRYIPMAVTQAARCASHSLIAFLRLIFLIKQRCKAGNDRIASYRKLSGQAVWPANFIMPRNFPRHCDPRHTCSTQIGERMRGTRVWFPLPYPPTPANLLALRLIPERRQSSCPASAELSLAWWGLARLDISLFAKPLCRSRKLLRLLELRGRAIGSMRNSSNIRREPDATVRSSKLPGPTQARMGHSVVRRRDTSPTCPPAFRHWPRRDGSAWLAQKAEGQAVRTNGRITLKLASASATQMAMKASVGGTVICSARRRMPPCRA
jgi:hypothetical protein